MSKKLKYTPASFTIYGILLYLIVFIIGPYKWEIKNWNAILVLVIGYICLFLGMAVYKYYNRHYKITLHRNRTSLNTLQNNGITTFRIPYFGECILLFVELLVLISFVLYMRNISTYISISHLSEISDTRYLLADKLSFIQKLSNYLILMGIPVFIITAYADIIRIKALRVLRIICFWLPSISFIVTGARWDFILSLFIFVSIDTSSDELKARFKRKWPFLIVSIGIIAVLLFISFNLFETRGTGNSITTYSPNYGNIDIKDIYVPLMSKGKGLFQTFLYVTHSVPYYSAVFDKIDFSHPQYGTYALGYLRIFSPVFNSWNAFAYYNPVLSGSYTPTITGFFIDFGFWGSFFGMFLSGIYFEFVELNSKKYALMRFIKPIILFRCFMSLQGYFYTMAANDFIVFILVILWIIVIFINKSLGRKNK